MVDGGELLRCSTCVTILGACTVLESTAGAQQVVDHGSVKLFISFDD